MSLEEIVNVTITTNGRGVSRKSFGVPMVVGPHSHFVELAREYNLSTALASMVSDGFSVYDPIYKAVAALARNTPKPTKVIVGKLTTSYDQTFDLTVLPITAVGGEVFAFEIVHPDGTVTSISYSATAAQDEDAIATAVAALVDAITGLTASATLNVISVAADNSDEQWFVRELDTNLVEFLETTPDSSLAANVTAISAVNDDWYGLINATPQSKARSLALAAHVETQEKILGVTTFDTDCGDQASTTDIMYALNAAQYFRTYCIYSESQGDHAAAVWMGNRFPFDPGSSTWAYKPLSGVTVDSLSAGFVSAVKAKSGNVYTTFAGLPVTEEGKMAAGEWIDVIRGRDWLVARIRERVFGLLANAPKVPFTDPGIDQVKAQVAAQLQEGIGNLYLAASPEPIVTAPLAADVSDANKTARLLPDVAFEATLAGAIHATNISGVLKV